MICLHIESYVFVLPFNPSPFHTPIRIHQNTLTSSAPNHPIRIRRRTDQRRRGGERHVQRGARRSAARHLLVIEHRAGGVGRAQFHCAAPECAHQHVERGLAGRPTPRHIQVHGPECGRPSGASGRAARERCLYIFCDHICGEANWLFCVYRGFSYVFDIILHFHLLNRFERLHCTAKI